MDYKASSPLTGEIRTDLDTSIQPHEDELIMPTLQMMRSEMPPNINAMPDPELPVIKLNSPVRPAKSEWIPRPLKRHSLNVPQSKPKSKLVKGRTIVDTAVFLNQAERRVVDDEQDQAAEEVTVYDLETHFCSTVDLSEAAFIQRENKLIIYQNLSSESLKTVRKQFGLHPIIESECASTYFNTKDEFINLDDTYLININEIPPDDNIEMTIGVKLIVCQTTILAFVSQPAFCLQHIIEGRADEGQIEIEDKHIKLLEMHKSTTYRSQTFNSNAEDQQGAIELYNMPVEIGPEFGVSMIETLLFRIFDTTLARLEFVVLKLEVTTENINEGAMNLGFHDRVEFIRDLNIARKSFIFVRELLLPKLKFFKKVQSSKKFTPEFGIYIKQLKSRSEFLLRILNTSDEMLGTAEEIFGVKIEDTMTQLSQKMNDLMKSFSAIATIFLPLNLLAGLWGMNVIVPGQELEEDWPFAIICIVWLVLFLLGLYFLKKKNMV